MSIFDTLTVESFKTQFPRFSPQYLTDVKFKMATTYFKDDIVYFNNNFYICKVESTLNEPTTASDWKLYNTTVLNYTQDSDIVNAFGEAKINFNEGLFPNEEIALMVFLYLTAHYLTVDFNNAIGSNNIGVLTSKSVGPVSEGYSLPQWLTSNPALSVYASTGYGIKYASLIRPYLVGNIMLFKGRTTIG